MEKRYLLISVADREIDAGRYATLKEAQDAMKQSLADSSSCKDFDDLLESFGNDVVDLEKGRYTTNSGTWELLETYAYRNEGCNHSNYDWQIVDLETC